MRSVIKRPTDIIISTTSEHTDAKSRQTSTTNGHTNGYASTTSRQTSTASTERGQISNEPVLN